MATCTRAVLFNNCGCVGSACLVLLHAIAQARCGCLFFAAVFFWRLFPRSHKGDSAGVVVGAPLLAGHLACENHWKPKWDEFIKTDSSQHSSTTHCWPFAFHPQFLQFLFPHGFSMVWEFIQVFGVLWTWGFFTDACKFRSSVRLKPCRRKEARLRTEEGKNSTQWRIRSRIGIEFHDQCWWLWQLLTEVNMSPHEWV